MIGVVTTRSARQAPDPAEVQLVVNDQRDCPWCDLTGADFSDVNFQGVDLENAYCDWATKFPAGSGWACEGVTIERR